MSDDPPRERDAIHDDHPTRGDGTARGRGPGRGQGPTHGKGPTRGREASADPGTTQDRQGPPGGDGASTGDATRCAWADGPEVLRRHHDEEWGRPLHGERELFELLTLVTFGSGLSWGTVLRKRDAFRAAFAGFDPERVAAFGPPDVSRLLADAGIVRNRRKVDAALRNARATVGLRADGGLDALLWSYADAARAERPSPGWRPATRAEVPSGTATSTALGSDLRARGFALVGPTVAYALLQTAGIVDDHVAGCPVATCAPPPAAATAGARVGRTGSARTVLSSGTP